MSRVGKSPIKIPKEVRLEVLQNQIKISGPKGELSRLLPPGVEIKLEKDKETAQVILKNGKNKHLWGTLRTLISNMILGVTSGFSKELEILGVGFKAAKEGEALVLHLGFSHPIIFKSSPGINFEISKNKIIVSGLDKEKVNHVAAQLRALKPPEPYKAKGIRYKDELVRRKAGKAAKAVGSLSKGGV